MAWHRKQATARRDGIYNVREGGFAKASKSCCQSRTREGDCGWPCYLSLSVHPAHHSDLVRAPRHQKEVAEAALLATKAIKLSSDRSGLYSRR